MSYSNLTFGDLVIGDEFARCSMPHYGVYRKLSNSAIDNTEVITYGGGSEEGDTISFDKYSPVILIRSKTVPVNPPNKQSDIDLLWEVFTKACDEESLVSLVLCSDGSGHIEPSSDYIDPDISFNSLKDAIEKIRGKKL